MALSFSLGVFLGVLPGTGAVAAGVCAAFIRLNVPIAVAGALLSNNPLTGVFIYAAGYGLGQALFNGYLPDSKIAQISIATILGTIVLAIALGLIAYLLAFPVAWWIQKKRNASRSKPI